MIAHENFLTTNISRLYQPSYNGKTKQHENYTRLTGQVPKIFNIL